MAPHVSMATKNISDGQDYYLRAAFDDWSVAGGGGGA